MAKGLRTPRAFDFEGWWDLISELPHDWDSWRAQQNLVCTRTQEKGRVIPQETNSDLPVSVQESLAKVWVDSGLP